MANAEVRICAHATPEADGNRTAKDLRRARYIVSLRNRRGMGNVEARICAPAKPEADGLRRAKHLRRASAAADRAPTKPAGDGKCRGKNLRPRDTRGGWPSRWQASAPGIRHGGCPCEEKTAHRSGGRVDRSWRAATTRLAWRRRSGGLRRGGPDRLGRGSGGANR
jgi:hypothetical protein